LGGVNNNVFFSLYLQLVEEWEPLEYQRHIDVVEAALTAAVQDAMGDTRTAGRAAFAAYAANMPERANALLRRMDSGLQQKLTTAVAQYAAGHNLMAGEASSGVARFLQAEVCVRCCVSSTSMSTQHNRNLLCFLAAVIANRMRTGCCVHIDDHQSLMLRFCAVCALCSSSTCHGATANQQQACTLSTAQPRKPACCSCCRLHGPTRS
jgi:hypothetical protein